MRISILLASALLSYEIIKAVHIYLFTFAGLMLTGTFVGLYYYLGL